MNMSGHHSASYVDSGFGGSSRSSSWRERRHKRNENRRHDWDEERSGLGGGSLQTYRFVSDIPEQEHHDRRGQELEHLRRLVRDLELKVQGRHRRWNHSESPKGSISVGDSHGETSHRSGSRRSRERSQDFTDGESVSPEQRRHRSAAMNAMSRALRKATKSPFSDEIEHAPLPRRFSIPPFISYDKRKIPSSMSAITFR